MKIPRPQKSPTRKIDTAGIYASRRALPTDRSGLCSDRCYAGAGGDFSMCDAGCWALAVARTATTPKNRRQHP